MKPETKPQLHQSQIDLLFQCGHKFYLQYILGQRSYSSTALFLGEVVHKAAATDLTHKLENEGVLLDAEAVKDNALDFTCELWDSAPLLLDDEEKEAGLKKVKGNLIDSSVSLSTLHHEACAPNIFPVEGGIERAWLIECPGYPFDLSGKMDVDAGESLRDLKTSKAAPGQIVADRSFQLSIYAMAKYLIDKVMVKRIFYDVLTKTKVPKAITYETSRTIDDFRTARARFEIACKLIENGIFVPARSTDFLCSPKYCSFYDSCKYVSNPKQISMSIPNSNIPIGTKKGGENGRTNGKRKRVIGAGSAEWLNAAGVSG